MQPIHAAMHTQHGAVQSIHPAMHGLHVTVNLGHENMYFVLKFLP